MAALRSLKDVLVHLCNFHLNSLLVRVDQFLVRLHILLVLETVATDGSVLLTEEEGLAVYVEIQDLEKGQPVVKVENLRTSHLRALRQLGNVSVNRLDVLG